MVKVTASTIENAIRLDSLIFPVLPEIGLRILEALEAPNASETEIVRLVSLDPSLVGYLLQVGNSPLYYGTAETLEVRDCLRKFGASLSSRLVISFLVRNLFTSPCKRIEGVLRDIWTHSVLVGACAKGIGLAEGRIDTEALFITGVLHDIGKLPVLAYLESHATGLADMNELDRVVSQHHTEIGEMLLSFWGLPEIYQVAIRAVQLEPSPLQAKYPDQCRIAKEAHDLCANSGNNPEQTLSQLRKKYPDVDGAQSAAVKAATQAFDLIN